MSRRDVLKVSALGAAALALPFERVARAKTASKIAESKIPRPYTLPFKVPPVIDGRGGGTITIAQKMQNAVILPGVQTPIFGYNGITPGPTILARRGTPLNIAVSNELPAKHPNWGYEAWTSVHLHGSASKPQFDGYASDITRVGQTKTYQFPNNQESRTLWYHDHGVHHTAENAYMGLAAMYLMSDELEDRLPIPKGSHDLPMVIADKMFAANGSLMYDDEGHSGLYGDVMLVNGQPWPNLKVAKRKYRFRILNASLSRGLRLQLSNSAPMTVIATDGGLMPKPQTTVQLRVGMAERYEVVIDFAQYAPGTKIQLRNLGVPNSRDFDNTDKVMQFEVTADAFDAANNDVPAELNPQNEIMLLDETKVPGIKTVKLDLHRSNSTWKVNNTTWDDIVKSNYQTVVANPQPDEVQIWEITNKSGGWFHPTHIHLVDFKILSRNGKAPFNYELGPKDVAYVGENETVRLITKFAHQTGRYMIHCHNLPHEDHDMMTQFRVGTDTVDNDPMTSAPAGPIGAGGGGVTVIPVVNTSTPATPTATPTAVPTTAATTATPRPATTTTTRRRR
ncbi:multicopper oxidase family protein [Pseudonocardia charpentierae]|uniref:Multicopper oxidase domain-containing protein n=1 Tax=Pseudonocardia charpentierae TaxID=3075545 RepID=A0ABU2N7F3_9PSEU|nr:multicopper oxidase domain-containing protein [Pseudonocardia sp. DSM 45834]MDT0349423.1 multicopper oxidase domain-containing protein [Pseudonocardia sp. DSM 45834]